MTVTSIRNGTPGFLNEMPVAQTSLSGSMQEWMVRCRVSSMRPIAGCLSGPTTSVPSRIVTCPGTSWPA